MVTIVYLSSGKAQQSTVPNWALKIRNRIIRIQEKAISRWFPILFISKYYIVLPEYYQSLYKESLEQPPPFAGRHTGRQRAGARPQRGRDQHPLGSSFALHGSQSLKLKENATKTRKNLRQNLA